MVEVEQYRKIIGDLFIAYVNDLPYIRIPANIDKSLLVKMCSYHRVDNIFLEKVEEEIKSDIVDLIGNKYKLAKNKYNVYNTLARKITRKMIEEGIDFCFLKGYALSLDKYKGIGHRYFNDLDIFVSSRDIDKLILLMEQLGFRYGRVKSGKFIYANRTYIIYQKMYTHELHNMVTMIGEEYCNLDINFLFSWKGLENDYETMRLIPFDKVKNSITKITKNKLCIPVLNDVYQFLHLCCHFYNEAIFFALNKTYKQGDPKEILLVRLLDIYLLLNSKLILDEAIKVAIEYDFFL